MSLTGHQQNEIVKTIARAIIGFRNAERWREVMVLSARPDGRLPPEPYTRKWEDCIPEAEEAFTAIRKILDAALPIIEAAIVSDKPDCHELVSDKPGGDNG